MDVGGRLAVLEVPDLDEAGGPLHGVDAAARGVEAGAVARAHVVDHGAAVVAAAVAAVGVADGGARLAAGTGADGAAGRRVQRHLVLRVVVDALDDVDLAAVGPVRTDHPESGPGTAGRAWQYR